MIVDSEVVANTALANVLTQSGYPLSTEDAMNLYMGTRWIDCHRHIQEQSGLEFDCEALGRRVDEEIAVRIGEITQIDGLQSFLAGQTHRRLAIASSSEKTWLDANLARIGLADHFGERVFSAAGFTRGKPHPDIYLHAASHLGVDPSACLVIEDHPVGIAAGAAAGMTVIALLAGGHIREGHAQKALAAGAHFVAGTYGELAEILPKLEQPWRHDAT